MTRPTDADGSAEPGTAGARSCPAGRTPHGGAKRTLRSALFRHDNDYGIDPRSPALRLPALRVSCVVPYYETGELALACVARLQDALRCYQAAQPGPPPATQIVVVDDGSTRRRFPDDVFRAVHVIRLPVNKGRSAARNAGLRASARFDVVMFVDSDMLIQTDQIIRTCELWDSVGVESTTRPAVVANLFSTLPRRVDYSTDVDAVLAGASVRMDWRWRCRYQPSWIASTGDWIYVGRTFELVCQTDFFRRWSGMLGPWTLPNMVLGGCFAAPVELALGVGGFDDSFVTYGYTETTLVARLVAQGIPVIPQVKSAAVHVDANPAHHTQARRNALLRNAHHRFFTEFLARDVA